MTISVVVASVVFVFAQALNLVLKAHERKPRVCTQKQKHYGLRLTREWEARSILK